jgi:hypothetical protein
MFSGSANASTEVRKPPAWFRRADLVTHITAKDREKIADELSRQAADRTIAVISAVVRSIREQTVQAQQEQQIIQQETGEPQPSIYDLFEIPQEQAPDFEDLDNLLAPQEEAPPAGEGGEEQAPQDLFEGLPPLE